MEPVCQHVYDANDVEISEPAVTPRSSPFAFNRRANQIGRVAAEMPGRQWAVGGFHSPVQPCDARGGRNEQRRTNGAAVSRNPDN
jgi:hypothetical protein